MKWGKETIDGPGGSIIMIDRRGHDWDEKSQTWIEYGLVVSGMVWTPSLKVHFGPEYQIKNLEEAIALFQV